MPSVSKRQGLKKEVKPEVKNSDLKIRKQSGPRRKKGGHQASVSKVGFLSCIIMTMGFEMLVTQKHQIERMAKHNTTWGDGASAIHRFSSEPPLQRLMLRFSSELPLHCVILQV